MGLVDSAAGGNERERERVPITSVPRTRQERKSGNDHSGESEGNHVEEPANAAQKACGDTSVARAKQSGDEWKVNRVQEHGSKSRVGSQEETRRRLPFDPVRKQVSFDGHFSNNTSHRSTGRLVVGATPPEKRNFGTELFGENKDRNLVQLHVRFDQTLAGWWFGKRGGRSLHTHELEEPRCAAQQQ